MKIAFLTPEFPHLKTGHAGGIGSSIYNLTKGLVALGHQVSVIVFNQNADEVFTDENITIYRVRNIKVKGFSFFLTQKKIQRLINSLVAKKQLDIVEAPDWTGCSAFIKAKCPLIIRLNGSDTYFCHLDKRPVKWKNKFFEGKALKNADGILSVSRFTGELTNKLFNIDKKFEVIPNGIDITQFEAPAFHNETPTVFYFGTLIRKKGVFELPYIFNAIFKENENAQLLLVGGDSFDIATGSASSWEMMKPLFDEAALKNVFYLGKKAYSDIKNQIEQATVCIFPSFAEALPVSWIEAMAMQKPIVASDIGWAPEMITDNIDGFLVNPKYHQEFAARILEVLSDPQLQSRIGANAKKKVAEKFSIEVVARQNVEFYDKFLIKNITA